MGAKGSVTDTKTTRALVIVLSALGRRRMVRADGLMVLALARDLASLERVQFCASLQYLPTHPSRAGRW